MKLAELEIQRKALLKEIELLNIDISEYYKKHGRTKLYWSMLRDKLKLFSDLKKITKEIELINIRQSSFRFGNPFLNM